MDVKMAAQTIRDTVSMEQIIAFYGYETKRGGFMVCPFHGDSDPSLKVYKNKAGHSGWHCFGCGRGGSVIDFVKEHENCSFTTAVRAIDKSLGLRLLDRTENPFSEDKRIRLQHWMDDFVSAVYEYCDLMISMLKSAQDKQYKRLKELEETKIVNVQALTPHDWDFIHTWKDESQYTDYRIEKIEEFKEVVAAWRRQKRAGKARSQ